MSQKLWRLVPIALVALMVGATPTSAQVLRGVLSERETYAPIDLGTVTLLTSEMDTLAQTITDDGGYFTFELERGGSYYLIARALGYRSVRSELVELSNRAVKVVEMSMAVQPVALSGLLVETDGEPEIPGLAGTGFYDRLAEGHGEFLLPGAVAQHPAAYTPQLFREMITIQLRDGPGAGGVGPWAARPWIRMDKMAGKLENRLCEPLIFVDNMLVEIMEGESLEDVAPRDQIEAIEVYKAPFGPPLQYFRDNSQASCGAILIWTRR